MIIKKLACDKCNRTAHWTSAPHFTAAEIRQSAQEEGWRYCAQMCGRKKADLCPECAVKVPGLRGRGRKKYYEQRN